MSDFLIFDQNKNNMMSDSDYAISGSRYFGVLGRKAVSALMNKLLYQLSAFVATYADVLETKLGNNLSDDDIARLENLLQGVLTYYDMINYCAKKGGDANNRFKCAFGRLPTTPGSYLRPLIASKNATNGRYKLWRQHEDNVLFQTFYGMSYFWVEATLSYGANATVIPIPLQRLSNNEEVEDYIKIAGISPIYGNNTETLNFWRDIVSFTHDGYNDRNNAYLTMQSSDGNNHQYNVKLLLYWDGGSYSP